MTPEATLRIGLAHGSVQSFSEESGALDVIVPDRATRAGLAYLALGDWHGGVEIDARTRYCGTPEPDRFKHGRPGEALLVSLEGPLAIPFVTALPTGSFAWQSLTLDLLDGDDAVLRLEGLLPEPRLRRLSLLQIRATGRARLESRSALAASIVHARPDFAFLEFDDDGLATECEAGDLDQIDPAGGALRAAADALSAEAADPGRSTEERDVSRTALARLYTYAQAVAS